MRSVKKIPVILVAAYSTEAGGARQRARTLRHARVDAGGTRLRLRALHVMGHSSARIARALDVREMTIRAITRGDAPTVSTALRDDIADLFDNWRDKHATERSHGQRATTRRRAIRGNWRAAADLDDDRLDTPGYRPDSNWKPAAGTGTTPGIHPAGRPRQNRRNSAANRKQPLKNLQPAQLGTAESRRPCQ